MMPPWHDVTLLTTFVISQVLVYSLHNMRGMLILSTLVLLLWTKSLLTRWYRTQTLTREFFKRLLYLLVTVVVSLAAVVVMWMPLYEAYACVASGLEPTTAHRVMEWRNTFFLLAGLFLALSSITQTDLVLKPSQVDNSSIAWVTKKISRAIYRFLRHFVRDVLSVLKTVERCTHVGGSGETKKRAAYLKHVDLSDDDFTDNDEENDLNVVTTKLRAQSPGADPAPSRRVNHNKERLGDLTTLSQKSLLPRWLRGLSRQHHQDRPGPAPDTTTTRRTPEQKNASVPSKKGRCVKQRNISRTPTLMDVTSPRHTSSTDGRLLKLKPWTEAPHTSTGDTGLQQSQSHPAVSTRPYNTRSAGERNHHQQGASGRCEEASPAPTRLQPRRHTRSSESSSSSIIYSTSHLLRRSVIPNPESSATGNRKPKKTGRDFKRKQPRQAISGSQERVIITPDGKTRSQNCERNVKTDVKTGSTKVAKLRLARKSVTPQNKCNGSPKYINRRKR